MSSTKVEFALAVEFIDAGNYDVQLSEYIDADGNTVLKEHIVKVSISYMGNKEPEKTVRRVRTVDDIVMGKSPQVLTLNTKVTIEFPYILGDFSPITQDLLNDFEALEKVMKKRHDANIQMYIKTMCVTTLNRIVEVIRWKTRATWLPFISEGDIFEFDASTRDEHGRGYTLGHADFGSYLSIPRLALAQSQVNGQILNALKNGHEAPFFDQLFLDANSFYERGRYNEAVIMGHAALEQLAVTHLFDTLEKELNPKAEQIKKEIEKTKHFTSIMSSFFEQVEKRTLEQNTDLWKKLLFVMDKRRIALHPHSRRLKEREARESLEFVVEICAWIDPQGIV